MLRNDYSRKDCPSNVQMVRYWQDSNGLSMVSERTLSSNKSGITLFLSSDKRWNRVFSAKCIFWLNRPMLFGLNLDIW